MNNPKKAITRAASDGDVETLKKLLATGIHPDNDFPRKQFPSPPMFYAIRKGHLEAVKLLHAHGADVNRISDPNFPMTYLMVAAQNGLRDVVEWLLQAGADPKFVNKCNGKTAYDSAANMGFEDIAEMLRVASGKTLTLDQQLVAVAQRGDVPAVENLLAAGAKYDGKNVGGFNAFMWACINGHEPIVKLFLQHGASPYQTGIDNCPAIQWAAMKGRAEVIDVLCEADQQLERRYPPRQKISNESLEERAHRVLESQNYAQAVAEQLKRLEEEEAINESAEWFGSTGLGEETERELPHYLRRELGESLIDVNSTKAADLKYLGEFQEVDMQVHYWKVTSASAGDDCYAYVEVDSEGRHSLGWGDKQPPKAG